MNGLSPGAIVRCREREWILLPSDNSALYRLRPLTGSENEIFAIHHQLSNLGIDRVTTAEFPPPKPEDAKDGVSAQLLWQASRLTLREGAGPFRSLGRISVRPRPYQFVPLMMALRLDPVRLLIADDVGIGKTIEALIITRELLDRGEIRRLCILCPPYLCDQWQKELWEKFQLESVVVRSGTISQLQRRIPAGDEHSVFNWFPITVVSIDFAKTERNRPLFLTHCPDFVIVDEAHSAARPGGSVRAQQQRHELLRKIAEKEDRNLILLTATPHSGIEESFRSLLSLLRPEFSDYDFGSLSDKQRDELVKHFVQRRRLDVLNWLGEDTPFPKREAQEISYELSKAYRDLFEKVYAFSKELVRRGEHLSGWKQRIRYWAALALLRCVMSSPAAAVAAIDARHYNENQTDTSHADDADEACLPFVYEPTDEESSDAQPAHIIGESMVEMADNERRRLREFAKLAAKLGGEKNDRKLAECIHLVRSLLDEGHHPIIWCRYIATAKYVAEHINKSLSHEYSGLRVVSVTGEQSDDERRVLVEELEKASYRVLVATDCLSEGINLQQSFSAAAHYDLPWNPNRLEQREGRVDRFGQTHESIKAVLLFGKDNPIDGAVLNVLLRKAKQISKALGITVPIPADSQTVMETVLNALFSERPGAEPTQLPLFEDTYVNDVHKRWEEAATREERNRTRFAQRAIKPEEVQRELEATDSVLGDPKVVEGFVHNSCQRMQVTLRRSNNCHWIMSGLEQLPEMVRDTVPGTNGTMPHEWRVGFTAPVLPGVTYVGRNHPFVATLAQFLLEESLSKGAKALAARCGAIRTTIVERRTILLLLRLRYKVSQGIDPDETSLLLAEESFVTGYHGFPEDGVEWIESNTSHNLLEQAAEKIADNVSEVERSELIRDVLDGWQALQSQLNQQIKVRAEELESAHRRVRESLKMKRRGLKVEPHLPADLLGLVVLMPVPKGVAR
jgi:superfamily II DNA or RNA helicase